MDNGQGGSGHRHMRVSSATGGDSNLNTLWEFSASPWRSLASVTVWRQHVFLYQQMNNKTETPKSSTITTGHAVPHSETQTALPDKSIASRDQ